MGSSRGCTYLEVLEVEPWKVRRSAAEGSAAVGMAGVRSSERWSEVELQQRRVAVGGDAAAGARARTRDW